MKESEPEAEKATRHDRNVTSIAAVAGSMGVANAEVMHPTDNHNLLLSVDSQGNTFIPNRVVGAPLTL